MDKSLNRKISSIDQAASNERQTSPGAIQKTKSQRYSTGLRKAFAKTSAGTGSTLTCYLDTDNTGPEVTVHFALTGGISNLSEGHITIVDGTWFWVVYNFAESRWEHIAPIEGSEDC